MQSFTIPNTENSETFSFPTDTQMPQPIVPVFLIHTLEQPFCAQPSCACHQNQVAVTALLTAIDQGALALQEIVNVTEGKQR
jgi:alcohol dehydrogenase YqhD (iron-dependent ADH family)